MTSRVVGARDPARATATLVALVTALLVACGSSADTSHGPSGNAVSNTTNLPPTTVPAPAPTSPPVPSPTGKPAPAAPAVIPPFTAQVTSVTAADLGASYHVGCPVGPESLRAVALSYWGFDGAPHVGTLVVHVGVVSAVEQVFHKLYDARFPIRSMRPTSEFGGSDPASMDADNTSGFNCRNAVATGPPRWSVHAYGQAIDVNTVENPYVEGGTVMPAAGAAYTDRSRLRPGMAGPGTVLNAAFASVGWAWGGRWSDPDYQHFSANGG